MVPNLEDTLRPFAVDGGPYNERQGCQRYKHQKNELIVTCSATPKAFFLSKTKRHYYHATTIVSKYRCRVMGSRTCTDCIDVGYLLDEVEVFGHGFIGNWNVGMEVTFSDAWISNAPDDSGGFSYNLYPIGSGHLTSISPTFDPSSVPIPGSLFLLSSGVLCLFRIIRV